MCLAVWAAVVVLCIVDWALSEVAAALRRSTATPSEAATAAPKASSNEAAERPALELLQLFPPEWMPLSAFELRMVASLRSAIAPTVWAAIPSDMLVAFVRGFAFHSAATRLADTERLLVTAAATRERLRTLELLREPPPDRDEWEQLYPVGPVGRDEEGHAIVVERIGQVVARQFCERYSLETPELMLRHAMYNREAARALCRHLAHEQRRRLYKISVVIDMRGLGLGHMSIVFVRRLKLIISTLLDVYPEATTRMYVINAPRIFTSLLRIIRPVLDEVVIAKLQVFGGRDAYGHHFARLNWKLEQPIEGSRLSWSAEVERLQLAGRAGGCSRPPWVPEEDRIALRTAGSALADADWGG